MAIGERKREENMRSVVSRVTIDGVCRRALKCPSMVFSFIMKVSSIIKERDDESSPDEREGFLFQKERETLVRHFFLFFFFLYA